MPGPRSVVEFCAVVQPFDIAIVGAGVMGAAAACEAARGGARVALIDQAKPPNPRAASVDHSKVFRFAYPDPFYTTLAVEALRGWRRLEDETATSLLTPTGVLMIGKAESTIESQTAETLRALGLQAEMLNSTETAARFPQFNPQAFAHAVFDPSGGLLNAGLAVKKMIELAGRRGVEVIECVRVTGLAQAAGGQVILSTDSGDTIACRRALMSAGPWTRGLLPILAARLVTTRQEVVYFEPRSGSAAFAAARFPVFVELGTGFYGFPIHHAGCVKIANHHKGKPVEMDDELTVGDEFIARCREFYAEFIPDLADADVRESKVCIYNNTPDDDFIVDWHPQLENVLVATGFSGHGFKFGPAIGRICADLLLAGKSNCDIERFRLARLSE